MKDANSLSLNDLMRISHDIEDLQKNLGMFKDFIEVEELRSIYKIEEDE